MDDSIPYSPQLSSPLTPWSDAHSTFGNSPYLDSSRAGSSTSLWTASSASSIMEPDDHSSELRCLELLAELEREKRRKSAEQKRHSANNGGGGGFSQQHSRDDSLPDVQPLDLSKARAARNAKYSQETKSQSSPAIHSLSNQKAQRRLSRRASFTTTDLSELDIDAILDAYTADALSLPHTTIDPVSSQGLPRSKQSHNLQSQILHSPPQGDLPSLPPVALQRNSTAYSTRSTRSSRSNGSTVTKSDQRRPAGPFPTITRQRSNASLAPRKLPFDATNAPPLPPSSSAHPTSVPMSNRTFSSFSRESNASSSSSGHSVPLRPLTASSRMSCASSTMSRQGSSASTHNSFRWSVATSSTVPTLVSDGSSDCGASRRGSFAPSSVGSFKQQQHTPNRSRRRPSASPFPGSPQEEDEDDRSWRRRNSDQQEEEDSESYEEKHSKDGGLISWEDFADELASLPVPSRPNPRRMNSQSSSHSSSARSRNGSSASSTFRPTFPSQNSPTTIFTSPESLRSTATLTSLSSSNPTSPFPSAPSPSTSPNNSRIGKKGILQGLRSKKSTRDLVSAFA